MAREWGDATVVAFASPDPGGIPVGSRWKLDSAVTAVLRTGRPARRDDWSDASGPLADGLRQMGVRSTVATPIVVEGRLWGGLGARR